MPSIDYGNAGPRKQVGQLGYKPPPPNNVDKAYQAATDTAQHQRGDYDDIMGRYRSFLGSEIPNLQQQIQGAFDRTGTGVDLPNYQETADYRGAFQNQKSLSETGGYSDQDIANIRERGTSPIRSVYANAQQNLQRQRSLQGGYSPNFGAVSAKMAREMSSQLSDQTTAVNAQIAKDVTANKMAASSVRSGMAANEQESRNAFALRRAELQGSLGANRADEIFKSFELPITAKSSALSGMTNLFGTEPGFFNSMSRHANTMGNLQGNMITNNRRAGLQAIGQSESGY